VNEGLDRVIANSHFAQTRSRAFGPDRMTAWRRMARCSPALSAA
jgi:hypothetical protein